jgi:hypothetical protein
MIGPGRGGQGPAIPITAIFVFLLDGGSQWEDTSCTTAPD